MSVIATAVAALIEAGVTGDALVAAIARMEAAQAAAQQPRRSQRPERVLDVSAKQWALLREVCFVRDEYTCVYCGCDVGSAPQCDHVIPLAAGGTSELHNLATACKSCNSRKAGRLVADWVRS
jgi:5-methylcytosine-specific restriction endonuclease McrA